ncbi:hypothetical protein A2635_05535 [Candidatus Peribacteria bacterium RIFCSPHIGHO2_01_FULL_51_9]|nr:MAG: hypothetical protein A2635_05535 [Candidatus Peribacteria bacterium RIFCSPHIGHO2_01_FULL_51_9]
MLTVSLLIDSPRTWYAPYADTLAREIKARGHTLTRVGSAETLPKGDVAFFLSCERIIPAELLKRNAYNIVIHASAVPEGRGWSPMAWQILEGKSEIVVSMFEAAETVDSGDVYDRERVRFEGHELIDELRVKEAAAIQTLALRSLTLMENGDMRGETQTGEPTFYARRKPNDSELDPARSIAEQFDLLRVVDNERYPAFFTLHGHTYILKIEKNKD